MGGGKSGLVSTVCACANESDYGHVVSLVPRPALPARARTKNRKERGEPGKIYHVRNVIGRFFSHVNLIKTDMRNCLKTNTVSALLSAKEGIKVTAGDCCKFIPSEELVKRMQSAVLYDVDHES